MSTTILSEWYSTTLTFARTLNGRLDDNDDDDDGEDQGRPYTPKPIIP